MVGGLVRRRAAMALVASVLVSALTAGAFAQPLSSRPIRILVPFGPGGIADLSTRVVAQKMGENMGQAIVVENRPGAGGIVAAEAAAKAEPDGHTLLLMSNGSAVSVGLFRSLPFDTVRDFAPISVLGVFDIAIVTAANSRFATLAELLAYARANPGKLNIGSVNIGSTQHLTAELFKTAAGIEAQVVPFNGTPAVITALRGGQLDAAVEILGPMLPQIRSKGVRALAVTGQRRAAELPEVPTAREAGVPGLVASSWNAFAAPAKTPRDIVARLNREMAAALNDAGVKRKLADLNVEAQPGTPEQASQLLASEIRRWGDVIRKAGIPQQ